MLFLFWQGSASESTLVCLLAARENAVRQLKENNPNLEEGTIRAKLVAYSSGTINIVKLEENMFVVINIGVTLKTKHPITISFVSY